MLKALINLAGTVAWGMFVILCVLAFVIGVPYVIAACAVGLICLLLHVAFDWFWMHVLAFVIIILLCMCIEVELD